MNKKKILGLVRHILTAGGGYLVGQGIIDESQAMEIVGALITVIGFAFSYFAPEKKQS